jgi:hypothetical protein
MRITIRLTALTLAAAGAAAGGLIAAAPAHAAPGAFVYTPKPTGTSGASTTAAQAKPKTITDPKNGVCIKTPGGTKAKNYTLGPVQLFSDAACTNKTILLKPMDKNGAPFEAIKAVK